MTLALVAAGVAFACGGDFPFPLLDNREASLLGLKSEDWLAEQMTDLMPRPTDTLKAMEQGNVTAVFVEKRDVDKSLAPRLTAMRAEQDGTAAYAKGDGLPEAVRLYTAGAVEFHAAAEARAAGADPTAHATAALSYFDRVLALPPEQRAPRATWASYMAGRAAIIAAKNEARAEVADGSAHAAVDDRATAYFQQTRELARQGLPDPLGLAVASYGEEARIALEKNALPHAMDLYLEQAARGSVSAGDSLLAVGRRLESDTALALRYVNDPRIQRLWFAGALAESQHEYYVDDEQSQPPHYEPDSRWVARVKQVTAAIDRSKVSQLDELAALAYSTGQFDLAESLAAGVNTGLACVVRAKLALRAGKRDVAAKEYAAAVSGRNRPRAAGAGILSDSSWSRVIAEKGVLDLSRSDYTEALSSLLDAGGDHWVDAAYVAERVLTIDELEAFVRDHATATRIAESAGENGYYISPLDTRGALRGLLARRELREQRFDKALAMFRSNDVKLGDENDPVVEKYRSVAAVAEDYVSALRRSESAWSRVERASALFEAAQLAKKYGMELMGYELSPDFAIYGGELNIAMNQSGPGDYTSADEIARASANAPPGTRFHYRGVAQDLAERAADNLPPRSHAFAAVLCTSLRWALRSDDADLAQTIYQRYVHEGAYVAWSEKFGDKCEEPDFPRASKLLWKMRLHSARVAVRPFKIPIVVLFAAAVIGGAVFATRRYRRRAKSSN